jgi:hypothetical protein
VAEAEEGIAAEDQSGDSECAQLDLRQLVGREGRGDRSMGGTQRRPGEKQVRLCLSSGGRTAFCGPNCASKPFQEMACVGQGCQGADGPAIFARLEGGSYRSTLADSTRVANARVKQ